MKLFHYAVMSWEWKMYVFIRFIVGVARRFCDINRGM
jgi:hypothetical protein